MGGEVACCLRSFSGRCPTVVLLAVLIGLLAALVPAGRGAQPDNPAFASSSGSDDEAEVEQQTPPPSSPSSSSASPSVVVVVPTPMPKVVFKQFLIDEIASNHSLVRSELLARGWREPSRGARKRGMGGPWKGSMAGFLWTFSSDRTKTVAAGSNQTILNHFAHFGEIGSKVGLWKNLYALHEAVEQVRSRRAAGTDYDSDGASGGSTHHHAGIVAERHGDRLPDVHKFFPRCYLLASDLEAQARSDLALDKAHIVQDMKRFLADFKRGESAMGPSPGAEEVAICDGDECTFPSGRQASQSGVQPWPQQSKIDGQKNIWIAKPGQAARGVGIQLFTNLTELLTFTLGPEHTTTLESQLSPSNTTATLREPLSPGIGLSSLASVNDSATQPENESVASASSSSGASFIVQKYIERPLLVRGLKFDIRQFVLVASLNPLVVFISDDFYLRFTAQPFTLDNISDRFLHLTNHQVQKDSPDFHHSEIEDNQWSSNTFINHLSEHYGVGTWEKDIKPRVDELIVTTMLSWPATGHRENSFEVLGLDIMLDEDLQPWLLEVNTNPGLHLLTDVVKSHHPRFVGDMFKVILDERESWKSLAEYYPQFLQNENERQTEPARYGSLRLAYKGRPL